MPNRIFLSLFHTLFCFVERTKLYKGSGDVLEYANSVSTSTSLRILVCMPELDLCRQRYRELSQCYPCRNDAARRDSGAMGRGPDGDLFNGY